MRTQSTNGRGQRPPRVLQVVTHPMGVKSMLKGQLRFLREAGFDVSVASSPGKDLVETAQADGVAPAEVPMQREIAPLSDLRSLWRLWRLTRRLRPVVCHVGTPKAGLLGGLAAFFAGVPQRFYTLHGLRFETETGLRRRLLVFTERLACRLAQRVVCVSASLRQQAIAAGVVAASKAVVIGSGSANGVDAACFAPMRLRTRVESLRKSLGIDPGVPVVGFVGRLTGDKGVTDLVEAHARLKPDFPELRLLLVGSFEEGDPLPRQTYEIIQNDPLILHTGFVDDAAPYYHLMDLLVLPSYREGLPTVALEAAAAGKPVVATDVTGSCEAVLAGETGFLVPPGDAPALAEAVSKILSNPHLARRLGRAGRRRVRQNFTPQRTWQGLVDLYQQSLDSPQLSQTAQNNTVSGAATAPLSARQVMPDTAPAFQQAGPSPAAQTLQEICPGYPLKRPLDVCIAAAGLVLASPLLAVAAVAILAIMGRPILFRQQRAGLGGKVFELYKLRTMKLGSGPDVQRLTRLGRFLRTWGIDELLQLGNVLRGEMSVVGPRPLLAEYLPLYDQQQILRHGVRPGITGWAQVRGRNDLSWLEKFDLDLWYVDHCSLALDLKIMLLTLWRLFRRHGVSQPGHATAERFRGGAERHSMGFRKRDA